MQAVTNLSDRSTIDLMEQSRQMIIEESTRTLSEIDLVPTSSLAADIGRANRVFVCGEGRSGLVVKTFAMRLMHLGLTVYVVGETTTPSIRAGDLLIAVSGSGSTSTVVQMANSARDAGATVAAITTDIGSDLARSASTVLMIPASSKHDRSGKVSAQFAGSLFEQTMFLLLDTLFHSETRRQAAGAEELWSRHTNLE